MEQALADAVAAAKRDDPLAPVTILVGSTLLRPYLQRRLATLLGGHANVSIVTAGELALRLGEAAMVEADRKPMPPLAARILAGEVARETAGYFEPVAHTTGFTTVLHRLFREFAQAGVNAGAFRTAKPSLPGSATKHAAMAELFESYESRRAEWYGIDDCFGAADATQLDARLLCVYGVWELTATMGEILTRLSATIDVHVFLPEAAPEPIDSALSTVVEWLRQSSATEAPAPVDDRPLTLLRHVQDHVLRSPIPPDTPPTDNSLRLISAADPTREVRACARACLTWAAEGIAFHEMAIAYRHPNTYRPLIDSVFREAGIPVYLHEGTPLSELPLGRRILAIVDLLDEDLERRAVIDTLSDLDLPKETRERYPLFSATRWDTLSRTAGIVGGHAQWTERLGQLRTDREVQIEAARPEVPQWLTDEVTRIVSLNAFIDDLAERSASRRQQAPLGEHLDHLESLLSTYVRGVDPVLTALRSLGRIDALTTPLSYGRFRDIVRAAIEGMRSDDVLDRRVGAFGRRGVNALDVNSLRHLRFEAVALLGLVERSWPSPVRQDPLLLDGERAALSEASGRRMPLRTTGDDPEPLQFAMAVQAASSRLVASYPRSDHAGGRAQLPSSFLRALAGAATGAVVSAERFDDLPQPLLRRERAAQTGAGVGQRALSAAEHLRGIIEEDRPLGAALLRRDPRFERAAVVDVARAGRTATEFDGVLSEALAPRLAEQWAIARPMPATALEKYAGCGMQFFLERILNVRVLEEPEALVSIGPLERGSLVHTTLQRFLTELGEDEWPRPARRDAHVPRLLAIADEECAGAEARGQTGFPLLWEHERQRLLDDLERWYDIEAAQEHDLPHRSYELRVGPLRRDETDGNPHSTDEPLVVEVGGRALRFQGRIDRVEWDDAGRFRVIDYKTGRVWKKDGDLEAGEALQLPLYIRSAAHALGLDPTGGDAEYFYATRDGGFQRIGFTHEDMEAQGPWLDDVLGTLITGVTTGVYAARPSDPRLCDRCAFDGLCDVRRHVLAATKSADPRIAPLGRLRDGSV
ncbi:MAG: exodeoxyribonuclease V subunit gamma [Solirubrobacterales bacterium]|nr:exodeoxyribonuclease V subunit gamma [Solirubrobacterales bacterium]